MLSIIVPCYNGLDYIKSNFECFSKQSSDKFEVIYIDDGSDDGSYDLLKELTFDNKLFKLFKIENSGVMNARRYALERASYDYVTFVDIDDIVDKFFVEKINNILLNRDYDIVFSNFKIKKNNIIKLKYDILPGIYSNIDFLKKTCMYGQWELCGRVFRKSLFADVVYPEKITIGEDALVFFQLLINSKIIYAIGDHLYTYIQNSNSASNIKSLEKCKDGLKAGLFIKNNLLMSNLLEEKYCNSVVLLFISNSTRRGIIKSSDEIYLELKKSLNLSSLNIIPVKKRIIVIFAFILMRFKF